MKTVIASIVYVFFRALYYVSIAVLWMLIRWAVIMLGVFFWEGIKYFCTPEGIGCLCFILLYAFVSGYFGKLYEWSEENKHDEIP